MKFLIAGLGSIGSQHLRNLLALGEGDILLYRTHQSTLPKGEFAGIPVETNLEQALKHEPDAVIISNPTALHLDVAIPAARAGCHLLLEKPVSNSMEGMNDLFKAVEESGVEVLVGYQYRFHPGLQIVKELLNEKAAGRLFSVRAHWGEYLPGWHPWEDYRQGYSARADLGGGVVLTLSHPFDYLRWLLGEASEVWAFIGTLGDLSLDVEDCAEIGVRFFNGVVGSIHLDYLQQPANHYIEVIGTEGTILWNYADGGVRIYHTKINEWQTITIQENFERNEMLLAEMRHFIDLISGKQKSLCTLDDGVRAVELALAAKRSVQENKIVHLNNEVERNY
jgi:predicted dehydrogenase